MANHFKPLTWAVKFLQLVARDCMDFVGKKPSTPPSVNVVEPPKLDSVLLEFCGVTYQFKMVTQTGPVSIYKEEYPPMIEDLGNFGKKLVPSPKTIWNKVTVIQCSSFEKAALQFIKNNFQDKNSVLDVAKIEMPKASQKTASIPVSEKQPTAIVADVRTPANELVIGKLVEAGVRVFPDKKKEGATYESYAIVVQTKRFPKTLQGEGLREALTHSQIQIGDDIIVKRLDRIEVPLVDKVTQKPLLDHEGNERMGSKWQWSIIRKK